MGYDADLVSLTYLWNWVGFPVVALPAGLGAISGLPVGVSLIGLPATDRALLAVAAVLQGALGVPALSPN
jgi:Asp-tRNA(Asn)/Glu-tRNA(Gln) amidotransferase A subunit family amidase